MLKINGNKAMNCLCTKLKTKRIKACLQILMRRKSGLLFQGGDDIIANFKPKAK